jgi:hypothetical protein
MSKRYEIVTPRSASDAAYADVEYLIRWIGADGADYQYMFYDAAFSESVKSEVINQKSSTNIQALLGEENRNITLTASDLSKNDLTIFAQLLRNKFVTRLKLDGTIERYAVDGNSFKYQLSDLRYNISFDLVQYSREQWK